jgi:hypothetical protein
MKPRIWVLFWLGYKNCAAQSNFISLGELLPLNQVLICLGTIPTVAKNVDGVAWFGESMFFGDRISPSFHFFGFNLNGFAAVSADQVVVMAGSAGAVKQFTVFAL